MGSINSGRRDGKPLVENSLEIDLAWLMRLGPIKLGMSGGGDKTWSIEGQCVGAIRFQLDLRQVDTACLILNFDLAPQNGQSRTVCQKVSLTSTVPHFGGRRWWLHCPITGARVRKLYLAPNGDQFASRNAIGMGYRVERLNHFDRPFEKLFRLQRKLGCPAGLGVVPDRPKGMWKRSYDRHLSYLANIELACGEEIGALISQTS